MAKCVAPRAERRGQRRAGVSPASCVTACGAALLLALLMAPTAQSANATATPVRVATEKELRAAMRGSSPIIVTNSIFLKHPLPNITNAVSISGDPVECKKQKWHTCRVDCRKKFRLFVVETGGLLTLNNLMLARGYAPDSEPVGGCIYMKERAVVNANRITFRFNGALSQTSGGGAVEVETGAVLTAVRCFFQRNYAGFGGAVAVAKSGTAVIKHSTFSRNTAFTAGGGVSMILGSTATLTGNQFVYNQAAIGGAVHVDQSTLSVCQTWSRLNNVSLAGPEVYASSLSKISKCNIPIWYFTTVSGSVVTRNCGFCTNA